MIRFARLATVALGVFCSPAAAGTVQFCNHYTVPINIASAFSDHKQGPVTRGWFTPEGGKCTQHLYRGNGNVFYVYAGFNNGNTVLSNNGFESAWFCVDMAKFQDDFRKHVKNNNLACETDNLHTRSFRKIIAPGDQPFTFNIRPPQGAPSASAPPAAAPPAAGSPIPSASPSLSPASPSRPAATPNACQLFPNLC